MFDSRSVNHKGQPTDAPIEDDVLGGLARRKFATGATPAAPDDFHSPAACRGAAPPRGPPSRRRLPQEPIPAGPLPHSHSADPAARPPRRGPATAATHFAGQSELTAQSLVTEVELCNPSLEAASAAWRAAAERYPQAISLDDPMFGFALSPGGVGREDNGGWMVEASQKIPWSGKRALRGNAASAEADAAQADVGDARLMLDEAAKMALADYYAAVREEEVNRTTVALLKQFRQIAKSKYEVNQATEQDVLQADVELADLESRHAELLRDRRVAVARINTLLHREADYPLPPPPTRSRQPTGSPAWRLCGRRRCNAGRTWRRCWPGSAWKRRTSNWPAASTGRTWRSMAKYDAFMPTDIRPQVGLNVNVPLRQQRRDAAVAEATAKVQQRRAEYQARLDQVRYEVQTAYDRLAQQRQAIAIYNEKILPSAERSLQSAQVNYTAGKVDFLRLIDAERQLHAQREKYYAALADYQRGMASLERAVGQRVASATRCTMNGGLSPSMRSPSPRTRPFPLPPQQPLAGWGGVCYSRFVGTVPTAGGAKMGFSLRGDVAQLGEHRLCKPGVDGSSPFVSTEKAITITAFCGRLGNHSANCPPFPRCDTKSLTAPLFRVSSLSIWFHLGATSLPLGCV